jgi:peptidoglycan hydrolase-like protein with peptidoglycan-binding domain
LGNVGEFTQIYSTTCLSIAKKKLFDDMSKAAKSPKNLLINALKGNIIGTNNTIGIYNKNEYGDIVKGIQIALVALGYNKRVESFEEKHKELINTNKVQSLPPAKDWDPSDKYYKNPSQTTEYGNNVQYKKNKYGQWFKYNNLYKSWEYLNNGWDGDKDVAKILSKQFKSDDVSWVKGNPLSPVNVMKDQYQQSQNKSALKLLTKNLHYFKLGYYDYNTEEMVKQYQRDKNIKSDGIFGSGTAKQMVKDLETLTGDIGTWFDLKTSDNEELSKTITKNLYYDYKDVTIVQNTSNVDVDSLKYEVLRTFEYLVKNDSLLVTESDLNVFNKEVINLNRLLEDETLTEDELNELRRLIDPTDSTSIKK